jgi:serine O-acetyltransferase
MILGARSIGDDVHIRQNTTFGVARRDRPHEKPVIEDGADIGCGAVVIGAVKVGRNTVVGANSVVTRDTPENSVVVGVPARVVRYPSGSKLSYGESIASTASAKNGAPALDR